MRFGYHFIEELDRLVEVSPAEVSAVLGKVLETYRPDFDYEDHLKSLLTKLATKGRRDDAIRFAEQLRRYLPGMLQLYTEITSQA